MTIFRGPGGTGSATSDSDTTEFQEFLVQSQAARDAAQAAQAAAELAETHAETAETNAETAETNAETAATNAASSASAASSSASAASSSASAASTSASSASTSASSASTSASSASTSASAASTSATAAATSATNAAASATAAASSATSASSSASTATTQASNAASSASAASTSATSASSSASSASTSSTNAASSATSAASSATAAASSATAAAASAASINPSDIVHITGTETVTGAKTFSSNPILSGGTANGVAYLNGSKVLTSGSALTFDGTKFSVGAFGATGRLFELYGSDALFDGAGQFDLLMGDGGVAYMSLTTTNDTTALKIRNYSGNSDIAVFERTTGNVGIGTSSPTFPLTRKGLAVKAATSDGAEVLIQSTADTGFDGFALIKTGSDAFIYNRNVGSLLFGTNSITRATLDSSGNLGLGVTPSAWASGWKALQLANGSSFVNNGATNYTGIFQNAYYNGTNNLYLSSTYALKYELVNGTHAWHTAPPGTAGNAISFTQAMTLNASGNLLVANQNPIVTVDGVTNGQFGFDITSSSTRVASFLYNATTGAINIGGNQSYSFPVFLSGGTERARIDSSGNLLVGTTASTYSYQAKNIVVADGSTAGISLTNLSQILTLTAGYGAGYVGTKSNHALVFTTNDIERARIDSSGNLLVGATSGSYKVNVSGDVNVTGSYRVNGVATTGLTGGQTGSAPLYGARAWVNFNGTGTVAIRASGNVSSITDNGVGDYTVNFGTAMPDANYAATIEGNGSLLTDFNNVQSGPFTQAPTTSAFRFVNNDSGGVITTRDLLYAYVAIFR